MAQMWDTMFPPYKPSFSDDEYIPAHVKQRLLEKGHWVPEYAEGTFLVYASDWMISHLEVPVAATVIYLFLIWYLKRMMKDRPAYSLKLPLFVWNVILASTLCRLFLLTVLAFSGIGAYYVVPVHVKAIYEQGFTYDYCSADEEYGSPWTLYFCLRFIRLLFVPLTRLVKSRSSSILSSFCYASASWCSSTGIITSRLCGSVGWRGGLSFSAEVRSLL